MPAVVRVVTDVAAVDRGFDYDLPDTLAHVGVGDRVRLNFHGRSVRGWVSEFVDQPDESLERKPVVKSLGYGPPPSMLPLLQWASWRWVAPLARFLTAASPLTNITSLPTPPLKAPLESSLRPATPLAPGVWQVPPTQDPLELILHAYDVTREREGSLLVLVPTDAWAQRLSGRLEQRGLAVAYGDTQWARMRAGWPVIVGARGAALAPTPRVSGAVIIDADDDAFRSEMSPTWDATSMLVERCRRDEAPLWLTSVMPSPMLLGTGPVHEVRDISAWPALTIVDRRRRDPHEGVLSLPALLAAQRALEGDEPVAVAVILQRLGGGRLYMCKKCGELARCETCGQPEREEGDALACPDNHERRENFCRSCSATNLKRVQSGVTTFVRDVGAQLGQAVTELTAASVDAPTTRVIVGTEAVFTRVRRCGVVIFVDFDQYLLAPRTEARRQAIEAVAKAGRLTGPRRDGRGEVVVQTRRDDDVLAALRGGDVSALRDDDRETAEILGMPPFGAMAELSGEGAAAFVDSLNLFGLRVATADGVTTLRAPSLAVLCDVLAEGRRGGGRLRVAVR